MADCSILIVDDDPIISATVAEVLSSEGYTTRTVTDGSEALQELTRWQPDLVILDMHMPLIDGWAFAQVLRARRLTFPILVMTAAQDRRTRARVEEINAAGYLAKPFSLEQLVEQIERLCQRPAA
jgi:DNA-binding response OmpR family regulator